MILALSLCHKLSRHLRPHPLERDILYGRPLKDAKVALVFLLKTG